MNADVFISYARSSAAKEAVVIRNALDRAGITTFLDTRVIPPGSEYPEDLAEGLLGSRVVVVLADETYFRRSWCVYELEVILTPYRFHRQAVGSPLDYIVVGLPVERTAEAVLAHLPPALGRHTWPRMDQTEALVTLITHCLTKSEMALREVLEDFDDLAVSRLREGGGVPPATHLTGAPSALSGLPESERHGFVGRDDDLWRIFHIHQTQQLEGGHASCAVRGAGGVGKTQLAAEYVWRYGPRYYQGGLVWINADCEEAELHSQFAKVLQALSGESTKSLDLVSRVAAVTEAAAEKGAVLWVIDNIPESKGGTRPKALAHWCPGWKHACLLCTSRRTIPDAVDCLVLNDLPLKAAVDFLTRPAVKRDQLNEAEWEKIARWVGCLPLALRILQTTLSEGFASPKALLDLATRSEPSLAIDNEIEALREEIPEGELRGVAEVFHFSYDNLKTEPKLMESAHLLSRLSPVPIPGAHARHLIPERHLGRLAARGWLQEGHLHDADKKLRYWRMHRVAASYLRGLSPDSGREFALLARGLHEQFKSQEGGDVAGMLEPHVLYLFRDMTSWQNLPADAVKAASEFATWILESNLDDTTWGNLHFSSAHLIFRFGIESSVLQRVRAAIEQRREQCIEQVVIIILGMTGSVAASNLCADLLRDPDPLVRRQAMAVVPKLTHGELVAVPFLDAVLEEIDPKEMLQPSEIRTQVWDYASGDVLWGLPRSSEGGAALEALALAGYSENIYQVLVRELSDGGSNIDRLHSVDRLGLYLRTIDTPIRLRILYDRPYDAATQEYDYPRNLWQYPTTHTQCPDLFKPLLEIARSSSEPHLVQRAVIVTSQCISGHAALREAVHDLINTRSFECARRIAEVAAMHRPDNPNGHWWRALAEHGLGHIEIALDNIQTVLAITPEFTEAQELKAEIEFELKAYDKVLQTTSQLLALEPDNQEGLWWQASSLMELSRAADALLPLERIVALDCQSIEAQLLLLAALYETNQFDKAIEQAKSVILDAPDEWRGYYYLAACKIEKLDFIASLLAADQAIERESDFGELWYMRAYSNGKLGNVEAAVSDAQRASELNPDDSRFSEFLEGLSDNSKSK